MLQRAASNAYSWWWASHIRTKQSKWLEQNLQDTEEKISDMLEIINYEGDSFAKRVEMYYSKRSELVNLIEEIFRSYRSLAGRFDHLSKELQSANSTIASVFPDRVPYEMYDDDDNFDQVSASTFRHDKPAIPKAKSLKKEFRNQAMFMSRKGTPKKAVGFQDSGLNKDEALKEIDKLQKEMLALQTEKEFMKSSYEYGYKKFNEIENQIIEKQKRVCDLQYEFEIGSVIDDNEGRTLMVNQALTSCQESLDKLKEKHEQSTKEVRAESRRIRHVTSKFEALRHKFKSLQMDQQGKPKRVSSIVELDNMDYDIDNEAKKREDTEASDQLEKPKRMPPTAELDYIIHDVDNENDRRDDIEASTTELDNMVYEIDNEENESLDIQALRKEIEEKLQLGSNESLTMKQLVEKIDVLVKRVIRLETAVVSEKAQVKRLKYEVDELQEQLRSLEEDKTALIEGSAATKKRINELEAELSRVKDHAKTVVEQNNSLEVNFTEAICNVNHLTVKLQEVEATGFSEGVIFGSDAKAYKGTEKLELVRSSLKDIGIGLKRMDKDVSAEGENIVDSDTSHKFDGDSGRGPEPVTENKADKKHLSVDFDSSYKLDDDSGKGPEPVGENQADKKHLSVDSDSSYKLEGDPEKGLEPMGENQADKKYLSVDSESSYKLDGNPEKGPEPVAENKADNKHLSVDSDSSYKLDIDSENGPEPVGENKDEKKYLSVASDLSYKHDGDPEKSPEQMGEIASGSSYKLNIDSEKGQEPVGENKADMKSLSETASSIPNTEFDQPETDEEEEINWRQLYLSRLDDREKILLDEYSHVLKNYREVRKKLSEVDKKNREAFFHLASQIKELKNEVALRDQVIQSLRRKFSSLVENKDENLVEDKAIRRSTSQESDLTEAVQPSPIDEKKAEQTTWGGFKESAENVGVHVMQVKPESRPHGVLTVEDEIRSGIDELLEENLEFWLSSRSTFDVCNFQDEITRVTNAGDNSGETGISVYEAAKFQGEVLNMKQEIKRVSEQLISGFTRARQLKEEIEKIMADLDKELWSSPSLHSLYHSRSWRPRIPLQSFLFGIKFRSKKKKKKTLMKQLSYIIEPKEPSE
ncbi:Protein NETWORKED 2A [Hibiscus syriacus]|uniref:Protein NETWORKED 2A n=1 Tax=Hibiscus syriacus TaxID=106335 RepID=A0A6A2WL39_HIBSY|nr:Protein NETWORKED 2A [Hibiscus syriacus]